jgi:hypothetical protein
MASRKDHQYYFSRFIFLNYSSEVDGGGWCEVSKPLQINSHLRDITRCHAISAKFHDFFYFACVSIHNYLGLR